MIAVGRLVALPVSVVGRLRSPGAWEAVNIGVETITGELDGGVDAWAAAGHRLARTRLVDAADIDAEVDADDAGHVRRSSTRPGM
ncbi:MAG: hypothetical protein ABT15_00660 [Pseudonocardia sp. SCN 73-27]|nr:MAG: hypothetical protein ABS80_06035 [Pseudonocardia sp. SCN 72-51]ODV09159.1 MAG: hypothetical protein ABT15_00660 [Pseudonocardia sp. SCN 73-27]